MQADASYIVFSQYGLPLKVLSAILRTVFTQPVEQWLVTSIHSGHVTDVEVGLGKPEADGDGVEVAISVAVAVGLPVAKSVAVGEGVGDDVGDSVGVDIQSSQVSKVP